MKVNSCFLRRCPDVRICSAFVFLVLCSGLSLKAATAFLKIVATQPGVEGPVAIRAVIQQPDGTIVPGEWGDSQWPVVAIRGKAIAPETTLELPLGTSTLTIGKGPDFFPQTLTVDLSEEGKTYALNVPLQPVLDLYTKGWRGGDAHVHFFHGDNQVARTPEEAYAICGAGGLNWVSLAGEHYGAGLLNRDDAAAVWEQSEAPDCQLWLGSEAPKSAWGHFASLGEDPWSISESLPYSEGIHDIHAQGGVSFPVHPDRLFPSRSSEAGYTFYPLNNHNKFLPIAALSGHLLDGWSAISDQPSGPGFLTTYQKLLGMGYKVPLLADSDYCLDRINNGLKAPGFWMNYVHTGGQPLSRAAVSEGIRQGHVMATTGPLVLMSIDGELPGTSFPADGVTPRQLRIEASYAFNPWTLSSSNFAGTERCVIQSVELLRNGEVARTWHPNEPHVIIEESIPAESAPCNYMVRVLGNEGVWMAGYSSPFYFEAQPAPRQPSVFKPLINGRLYDAASGEPLAGTVSSVRFGVTEWTIPTDENGLFRARVPLDATLVARDQQGREIARDWMSYEPAYAFGHYLPERYGNKAAAIDDFAELVREMTWEFPMGRQSPTSYLQTSLDADAALSEVAVLSAPSRRPDKQNTEIVMVLVDKTQVQHGDTVNYAVIFRTPDGLPPSETVKVQFGGWDPNYPRLYTPFAKLIAETGPSEPIVDLGNGFYMRQSSVVVPAWVQNMNRTTGGVRLRVTVRKTADVLEDAHLTFRIGPTRRGLLVNTMWDGAPATWAGRGIGPCNFVREIGWQARYPDYRTATIQLRLNGSVVTLNPATDTASVPDADDAIFEDHLYYDAQCEPDYRNISFRDPVRAQPAQPDFASVPMADPVDATPPTVAAIEPRQHAEVRSPVSFYYFVDDAGLSGAAEARLYVNGEAIAANLSSASPVVLDLAPGDYTWRVRGVDQAGNVGFSEEKQLRVLTPAGEELPGGTPKNWAVFAGEDRTSGGTWKGKYGTEGYSIIGDSTSYPSYAFVRTSGHGQWLWNANTSSAAAPQRGSGETRLAACYYATSPYDLRFTFRDSMDHRVSLYLLDWDFIQREERIEVVDANTGAQLAERNVSAFGNGVYLTWILKGDVIVRIHPSQGNGVVSAIFFDPQVARTQVAAPVFAPASGTFEQEAQVTISSELTEDAIYYTLDGSTPSADSIPYTGPFSLHTSAMVQAIAIAAGLEPSGVASANYTIVPPPTPPLAQVQFVGSDLSTQGDWKGRYGNDGEMILQDQQSVPSYAAVIPAQKVDWTWKSSTDDSRALQRLASDARLAACWYSASSFEIDLNLTDGATHVVSFYCVDWDASERTQRIEILDFNTRQVLDEAELQEFGDGIYLTYRINGRVIIRFSQVLGNNAVLSGIFFDPVTPRAAAPVISPFAGTFETEVAVEISSTQSGATIYYTVDGSAPDQSSAAYASPIILTNSATVKAMAVAEGLAPSFVTTTAYTRAQPPRPSDASVTFEGLDRLTGGNWKGKYGAAGHMVAKDSQLLPSYATLTTNRKLEWIWATAATEERLLQRAGSEARLAACWYEPDYFEVEVNFTDGAAHKLSLYCLDWDRAARLQRVEVIDFSTRQVLHTHELQSFGDGAYLSYRITGRVIIRLTKVQSHNAVLSGLFFD